jgi:hypothetical protein
MQFVVDRVTDVGWGVVAKLSVMNGEVLILDRLHANPVW